MGIEFVNRLKDMLRVSVLGSPRPDRVKLHELRPGGTVTVLPEEYGTVLGHPRYPAGIAFDHTSPDAAWVVRKGHPSFSVTGLLATPERGVRAVRNMLRRRKKPTVFQGIGIRFTPVDRDKR